MGSKAKIYGIIAAALFGAGAPFSKLLLSKLTPYQLAGLLYLGSGLTLLIIMIVQNILKIRTQTAKLEKRDIPWLFGSIISGGVLAPIALLLGLSRTPAATASILLNFETVSTTIIAVLFFREYIGRKVILAIVLLTVASLILTFDSSGRFGISWGAFLVLGACFCWGIDNNFTRNISSKDPVTIVVVKSISAGLFSFILSVILNNKMPDSGSVLSGMFLGGLSYGVSLIFFILALKDIGSSRASALFATAPFIGSLLSFIIYKNMPAINFFISVPLMIFGLFLLFNESHKHLHKHEAMDHEHPHRHDDGHHMHTHETEVDLSKVHTHKHHHDAIVHIHNHMPDIHHRHKHN